MAATESRAARHPALLLAGGGALIFLSFLRFGVPELGWLAFTPMLVLLHLRGTFLNHIALLAALIISMLLTVAKIATGEIPWLIVPMFAMPIALSYFVALVAAGFAHRRLGARLGAYTFATSITVLDWVQYTFTPGASWGILAHTQADNLPLIQFAALTGTGGITFLVAMGSALAAAVWSSGAHLVRRDLAVFAVVLLCVLVYGELRLASPAPGPAVRVGAVVSPVTHRELRAAAANVDTVRPYDDELFARSARAVGFGAQAVVWNEIATLTTVPGETALAARGEKFARDRGVMLVMAYGVVDSLHPLHYVNKYRLYLPDGSLADEYVKRHPAPGEPIPAGEAHARAIEYRGVKFSGGLCYDYSFPEIAADNAHDDADVALVPASDWRGIDPEHARMALINATAVGLAMVRPARAATSIVSDQYGRIIAAMRADSAGAGVLVADVPGERVPTFYARSGELVPNAALGYCLFILADLVRVAWKRRPRAP